MHVKTTKAHYYLMQAQVAHGNLIVPTVFKTFHKNFKTLFFMFKINFSVDI